MAPLHRGWTPDRGRRSGGARRADEVKGIRDQAQAIRAYLHQQRASLEMQNDAAEIKLRAERRLGEMLAEMAERGERATAGNPQWFHRETIDPTLADLGISKPQSSRWQRAATVPEPDFERLIAETKAARDRELTSVGVR